MRGWGAEANTVDRSDFDPHQRRISQPHQHQYPQQNQYSHASHHQQPFDHQTRHSLPLSPDSNPHSSREGFQRHVSGSSSSGFSGGPGPGLGPAPGVSGYQGVDGGSDMRARGDRQSGGWGSGGRGSFYGSQPGRGYGRGGGRGGGRQFSDFRKGYTGEGRPKSEMMGVLHAVELGRQGSERGIGGGWEEGEVVDEPVSASGSIKGSVSGRTGGEDYVEPSMSTAPEQPITSLQEQHEDSQAPERSDHEHESGRAPRRERINLPAEPENPDDLWRADPPTGKASESTPPPPFISQSPQSWSNGPHQPRNPYNSRSRQPYHGNGAHRRGEEYKAVIRSKIERLEDEEKPAFVKAKEKVQGDDGWGPGPGARPAPAAREAKAETKKGNTDAEVAADEEKKIKEQAEVWGVVGPADEQSGRGPMESNSKLFGPASLAAQSLEADQPGKVQLGHGRLPSEQRLQGDVSRRISDSGWGNRAKGPKRVGSSRGGRRGSEGEARESGSREGYKAAPAQQSEDIGESGQPQHDTPRQTDTLLDGEDANASIAVEPTERIDDTPAPSSPAESNQLQQAPVPGFSAHTRLLTMAVNELRPAVQEVSAQQLKRVGHKQDRADYVADWKRSQANELTGDTKDWEENSMSSETPSRGPSRKGRGATKAPPVSDQNGIPVVVALPRPGQRRLVESGRKLARDDETKQQAEGSVASGMSGYEAQPDEDSATIIRGTSFDGIWDTVPIDPIEDGVSSTKNVDATETGSTRSARSEKKIVVRLPTPKSSPLPSLAGSDHVPSPLVKMAVLAESQQQQREVEAVSSDSVNPQNQEDIVTQNLGDSILGLHSLAPAAVTLPEDAKPSDTVKILADVLESFDGPLVVPARIGSGESETIPTGRPSTYPASEVQHAAGPTANPVHRSRSSLGSLPLEKVIIPLDDLSDVESESQETVDASVRKETVPLPVVSPVPPYNYSHISPPIPYFTRQPGIRSAVIPERRLPEMSPEMARHSPLIYANEMPPQQANGISRYHGRAQDDTVGRKHLSHPAPTKWELKIESMLQNVSARQNQSDHTNQEIRSLRQEVTALQQHLQEARHRVYAAQSAVAEKQSHVEQLSTRIGENARTAQMYEGSLAARNADLAYCRGRIEHLESILLANQKFIADLQAKVAEMSQPKKGDKTTEESRIRSNLDRILDQQRQTLDQGKKFEQNLSVAVQKLQESLDSAKDTETDQVRQYESQAASLKERGLQLDVREANFQLTQVESERDYYKRLAKDLHDQLKQSNSKPRTVFDIDPDRPGFIETTYNSEFASTSLDRLIGPSRFGMPNTPPKSTLDLRELAR